MFHNRESDGRFLDLVGDAIGWLQDRRQAPDQRLPDRFNLVQSSGRGHHTPPTTIAHRIVDQSANGLLPSGEVFNAPALIFVHSF
jgi:hypothetical protein